MVGAIFSKTSVAVMIDGSTFAKTKKLISPSSLTNLSRDSTISNSQISFSFTNVLLFRGISSLLKLSKPSSTLKDFTFISTSSLPSKIVPTFLER